jgi:L-alanine-DL-glutamate epimerase-like enolase superfamily enzyme
MRVAARNAMVPGLVGIALSAVDIALWELKARLLGVPLVDLFGRARSAVPVYGSGGFTTYSDAELRERLAELVHNEGVAAVKIKIAERWGADERRDLHRIEVAREAIGTGPELMVDANGGYQVKQAARVAREAARFGVTWFEEPVSSDHLADLALLRGIVEPEVTAGEYGTDPGYFRRMCAAGAVDCLQVDATRAGGYSGFLAAAAVADSFGLQVSAHCAPTLHAPVCAAIPNLRHVEWFADHRRCDRMLFDGTGRVRAGVLDLDDRPGHGVTLRSDAERYRRA